MRCVPDRAGRPGVAVPIAQRDLSRHAEPMALTDEAHAVNEVVERLTLRFPALPKETVRAVVVASHAGLVGPVRAYVPILVEHQARQRLSELRQARA